MAKRLDGNQTLVIREVAKLDGMKWKAGCGWTFGTNHRTDNVLKSLVPRGLATMEGKHDGFGVYVLTPDAVAVGASL